MYDGDRAVQCNISLWSQNDHSGYAVGSVIQSSIA